ncbi:tetratricopeptide repeat protein [candidate division KSB1 bacterium]
MKKLSKNNGLVYFLAVLFYFGLLFGCGGSKETTKVLTPAEQQRIADSLNQAEFQAKTRELHIQLNLGKDAYDNERWQDAIPLLEKAVMMDKELHGENIKFPIRIRWLGNCYYNLGNKESALKYYEDYVNYEKKGEERADLHNRLIELYREFAKPDKVLEEFYKTIEILEREKAYNDLKSFYVTLADVMLGRGDTQEALRIYNRLIELFPDEKEYKDNKVALMRASSDDATMITEYEKNLREYPNDTDIMKSLIDLYTKSSNNQKVLEIADRILAIQKNDISILKIKAHAFLNLQRYNDAIGIYNTLLNVDSSDDSKKGYYCEIAESNIALKKFKTAVSDANKALQIDRNFGLAYIKKGKAYEGFVDDVLQKKGGYEKIDFGDKLAYKKAYDTYEQGTKDPMYKNEATRYMTGIKNSIPTEEDKFFHKGETKPKDAQYAWMF